MTDDRNWDQYLANLEPNDPNVVHLPRQNVVNDALLGDLESAAVANSDKYECYYGFLETTLLPRMRDERELTANELKNLASNYKRKFVEKHSNEDNSYLETDGVLLESSMITSSLDLEFSVEQRNDETAKLVQRASVTLNQLIDENWDELSTV